MHKSIFVRYCTAAFVPTVTETGIVLAPQSLGSAVKINYKRRRPFQAFPSSSSSKLFLSPSNNDGDDAQNQYKKYYQISGVGTKSFVSVKTNTNHELQTDVPKKMGGGDSAPQPVETLLAAWAGCTQATAMYVGRNMEPRLFIDKIEFDVEAYRDERGALGGDLPIQVREDDRKSELQLPDPEIPARLEKVVGTVKVYLRGKRRQNEGGGGEEERQLLLTDEQLSLLGEHTERRCPVANMMVMSGIEMDIKWMNG